MKIAVLSDTHGKIGSTRRALQLVRQHDVSAILHCGDIGSAALIPLFADWPTHFVFGNVDYDEEQLRQAIQLAGQTCHDRFGSITLADTRIALLHSDDHQRFEQAITSGEFDLVCYGHTHRAEHHLEGNCLVLNPGALHRAKPHQFAIVDLPERTVEQVVVPPADDWPQWD